MGFNAIQAAALAQLRISSWMSTNYFKRATFMAYLMGQTMMDSNDPGKIGRPGAQLLISGAPIGEADRMQFRGLSGYAWGIQAFKTSNSQVAAAYQNMPQVANPTTNANSMYRAQVVMPWTGTIQTPILLQNFDLDRAIAGSNTAEGQGIAMGRVIEDGVDGAKQEHLDVLAPMVWTGAPSSWNADPMDSLAGIINTCGTGIYAKSTRVSGTAIVSHTINATSGSGGDDSAAINNNLVDIVDAVNTRSAGIAVTGNGVNLVLTDMNNLVVWKNNIMARGQIVQVVDQIPQMGKLGFKRWALQYQECYAAGDPQCPVNYLGTLGTIAACLNTESWFFATHPLYNFTNTPFVNLKGTGLGNPNARQSFIETMPMMGCKDPSKQALVTNLV